MIDYRYQFDDTLVLTATAALRSPAQFNLDAQQSAMIGIDPAVGADQTVVVTFQGEPDEIAPPQLQARCADSTAVA